jgi:Na+/proline symporter
MHYVNWLAIFACGVASMLIGFLWYSPALFAKPWTREMGYDLNDKEKMAEMRKGAGPAYGASFIAAILSAFVLALFCRWMHVEAAMPGMLLAFHVWLGFVATVQLTNTLFMKQSLKLWAINTGYQLVFYLASGAILGALPVAR